MTDEQNTNSEAPPEPEGAKEGGNSKDQPKEKPSKVSELDCLRATNANVMLANATLQISQLQVQQQNIQTQLQLCARDQTDRRAHMQAVQAELIETYGIDFATQDVNWETGEIRTVRRAPPGPVPMPPAAGPAPGPAPSQEGDKK